MTTDRAENEPENQGHPRRWPAEMTECGERPAFTGGPMPLDEPPPLEGELVCVCGQPEGLHRAGDGCCEISGCVHFVAADELEEQTRPDVRVEYDVGEEPG
jgi:hypothetical protein